MGKLIPFDAARTELVGRRMVAAMERNADSSTLRSPEFNEWAAVFSRGFDPAPLAPAAEFFYGESSAPALAPAQGTITPEDMNTEARLNVHAARLSWMLDL